ncbi:hypothetical protein F7725_027490 [Dissostichus mawsoni]|uniref:Uncharacterized protein n=1 Tax=Dissostichus mawsoni TaxID=36200 RepID=A0A7J5XD17_DISMA|nr:hypothetical protein F7725_027490 [Dissostichus mawsoni]
MLSRIYLDGITTSGGPLLGLHIRTWASLALGLPMAFGGMGSMRFSTLGWSWCTRPTSLALQPRGRQGSTAMSTLILHLMLWSRIFSLDVVLSATSHVVKLWSLLMLVSKGVLDSLTGTAQGVLYRSTMGEFSSMTVGQWSMVADRSYTTMFSRLMRDLLQAMLWMQPMAVQVKVRVRSSQVSRPGLTGNRAAVWDSTRISTMRPCIR